MQLYQQEYLFPLYTVWLFMIGACIGSFLNVVIWRVPRGESILISMSHCPTCGYKIRPWQNIPIIAWLVLRGKCANCKCKISARYIFVEALTAVIFMAVWFQGWRMYQFWVQYPMMNSPFWPIELIGAYLLLLTLLIALAFIDYDHRIIPDGIILVGIGLAFILAVAFPGSHEILTAPGTLDGLRHKPMLFGFCNILGDNAGFLLRSTRLLAGVDWFLGILLGGGILWGISEIGKLLRGSKTFEEAEGTNIVLTSEGYEDPEDGFVSWEDTFIRERDCMSIEGELLHLKLNTPVENLTGESQKGSSFQLSEKGLVLEDTLIPLEAIQKAEFTTTRWTIPLEPMGLGDATLMAMIGAFLGPGSVIMILCLASFVGSFFGLLRVVVRTGKMHHAMPFGPFIAVAAFIYILYDDLILSLWLAALRLLMPMG